MDILESSADYVKSHLSNTDPGHDWSHTERVLQMARKIQREEGKGDLEIIELAVIFHDIADAKFHDGDEEAGGRMAFDYLIENGYPKEKAATIRDIINTISFRHSFGQTAQNSIEFQIVQDADRLDAMGAIGIARAFSYGGFKQREMYNPDIPPEEHKDTKAYKNANSPTLNHFYEKLFKLKESMHTETSKAIAKERHRKMEEFVKNFLDEWKGIQ